MAKRIQLSKRHTGSSGENEDRWYLIVADDGRQYVEHEWSYADRKGLDREGTKSVPVDDFLAGDYSDSIRDVVRVEMKRNP